jgi:hypothetical protein
MFQPSTWPSPGTLSVNNKTFFFLKYQALLEQQNKKIEISGLHHFLQNCEHRRVVLPAAGVEPDQRRRSLLPGWLVVRI